MKHHTPVSAILTQPSPESPPAQPHQLQEGTQLKDQCQAGTEREPCFCFPFFFTVLAWFLAAFFNLDCWVQAWI